MMLEESSHGFYRILPGLPMTGVVLENLQDLGAIQYGNTRICEPGGV